MAIPDLTNVAFHSTEEILAHPRFPHARDEFVNALLALYEHKPLLNRLLLEASRTVLVIMIMCLHARHKEDDRATWPTLHLIAASMAEHGHASPSRVHDLVSQLTQIGYLEQRVAPLDRRVRIITPTRKMILQDQDFLVSHYLPLQILFPDPGYGPIMARDPAFQLKQRLVSRDLFALGDRFGVSRTHVRNLLLEAEQMGLVRLSKGRNRSVEMRPQLVQAFDRFIADGMSGHDLCYRLALQAVA